MLKHKNKIFFSLDSVNVSYQLESVWKFNQLRTYSSFINWKLIEPIGWMMKFKLNYSTEFLSKRCREIVFCKVFVNLLSNNKQVTFIEIYYYKSHYHIQPMWFDWGWISCNTVISLELLNRIKVAQSQSQSFVEEQILNKSSSKEAIKLMFIELITIIV